jgi:nitronate monooxygenase
MPLWSNAFTRAAGIELPIVQAPMAGGSTTPELVAAVANAGALGSYAAAYAQPAEIASAIDAIRALTERPFAVNVFAPVDSGSQPDAREMLEVLAPLYAELGLAAPSLPARPPIVLDEQLTVLMDARVAIVSFTFGDLPAQAVAALKERGTYLIGTATTVDEAVALERHGIDAVIAQGSEAGGHRGGDGLIGTMALVPQIADAVRIPILAAGGIMDGRGIAAARLLGAAAAQLGTAFLCCDESGLPRSVKDALLAAHEDDTVVTNAMTGRHGRAIRNRLIDTLERAGTPPLGFAWQSALLGGLRRAAVDQGRADLLPLFAGQGLRMLRRGPAAQLVRDLARETEDLWSGGL